MARRLTNIERKEWQERLQVRMPPDAMLGLFDDLHDIMGFSMLRQAGVEFIRDAWTAARFAKLRGAREVRLWPDTRPDFEINVDGTYELFEVTEADELNRRRGDEYAPLEARQLAAAAAGDDDPIYDAEDDPVEDWIARAEQAPASLERAALKKAGGNYDSSWGLVILLNLSEYGIRQREVEACMVAATAPAKNHFREVWVLWNDKVYPT